MCIITALQLDGLTDGQTDSRKWQNNIVLCTLVHALLKHDNKKLS